MAAYLNVLKKMKTMLVKRIITALIITIVGVTFIFIGGWPFVFFISIILAVASWEYWNMYRKGGYSPNAAVIFAAVVLLAIMRFQKGFEGGDIIITGAVLAAMAFHTISYELGQPNTSLDFGITLGGILYIGWLGSYLISIRFLPDGLWWLLLTIPTVGISDGGAFLIGTRWGKNKIAPRLSPKKTWEGYLGGVIFGLIGGALLGALCHQNAPQITIFHGLILGAIVSFLTPLGDLGESMLKRQFDLKDSSNLLPGHGGFMDRIDSWLWAACLGYYTIVWFFI
ncbi:MAG: phosphatidate cytidylyltransferase [Anaerolineaceae bacterium]